MMGLKALVWRNTKLFFKDKGMFFSSMITPLILLVLFVTFLGNVYRDSLDMTVADVPGVTELPERLVEGFVGGWLFSSLLAVCCVTVAFCANMMMVQDKVTGAKADLTMAPVSRGCLAMGYYISTAVSTLLICLVALGACFIYLRNMGWYLSGEDVILTCLDVVLLTLFGTALSSVINHFLSTQGQISAVGTLVSAGYGFICGAYMPVSQFSEGIQTFISFLPGTYGTALLHRHLMRGTYDAMEDVLPLQAVEGLREAFDSDLVFQGHTVTESAMYLVLFGAVAILIGIYVVLGKVRKV